MSIDPVAFVAILVLVVLAPAYLRERRLCRELQTTLIDASRALSRAHAALLAAHAEHAVRDELAGLRKPPVSSN